MGRSYEYKSDPSSIYIGDLKVPKKYITITTGQNELELLEKTSLSIRFDSICTTSVNGKVYKLKTRESDPITEQFHEDDLLLKVNANKSDKIQLHLTWQPVLVLAFSKRILFENEVQPSPLPEIVSSLHSKGFDISAVQDPTLATHYLAMSDFVDYNLHIAVLRGIPVVSTKWTDYIETNADDVGNWLYKTPENLLLPGSASNYIFPEQQRSLLLAGSNTVISYEGSVLKPVRRLQTWLSCLGSTKIITVEVSDTPDSIQKAISKEFGSEELYIFNSQDDISGSEKIFGPNSNSTSELWKAVVNVDISSLKKFDPKNFPQSHPIVETIDLVDSNEPIIKQEQDSIPLTQRRKRRRVERVNDTDFFLFGLTVPSSQPVAESLQVNGTQENVEIASRLPTMIEDLQIKEPEKNHTASESIVLEDTTNEVNSQEVGGPLSVVGSAEPQEKSSEEKLADRDGETRKEEIIEATKQEEPKPKKPKQSKENWIVPQLSLAEAVLSTKKRADDDVKKELGFDDIDTDMNKLVLVEEIDMTRKTPAPSLALEANPSYKGRKNFKVFKKKQGPTINVTRTFLELRDDTSAYEIRFSDLQMAPPGPQISERVQLDFAKEMSNVKGYQPQSSQLFVAEVSSDEEDRQTSFSFLNKPKVASATYLDSDDDDDFGFKFSRK